MRVCSQWLTTQ
jgi:hypothetical protein